MDVGVLGGTFDPVHNGHLTIAEHAMRELALEYVMFVPANDPWLKGHGGITPAALRMEMVQHAIAQERHFRLSTVDIDRKGPTYTVDTLTDLRHQLGCGVELYFILGEDTLMELVKWKEPERIAQMCHLVAARRPGAVPADLQALDTAVPGIAARVIPLDNPRIFISSSEIRQRVAASLPISHLVPASVERYIKEHKLYTSS